MNTDQERFLAALPVNPVNKHEVRLAALRRRQARIGRQLRVLEDQKREAEDKVAEIYLEMRDEEAGKRPQD